MIHTGYVQIDTTGNCCMKDITNHVAEVVEQSQLGAGTVTVFVPGSTGGLTTVEFEPGLLQDIPAMFERLIPQTVAYEHDNTWHDGNGHSHVRASLLGPSLVVPFVERQMCLGTWQQIVLIDFDAKPRRRRLVVQVMGE